VRRYANRAFDPKLPLGVQKVNDGYVWCSGHPGPVTQH
jgi:hypothetical protein